LNGKSPELTAQLENISNIISESLTDLRKLSKTLTQPFEHTNFIDLLKTECEKINALKVCNVEFSSNIESILMPGNIGLFLLRILQEFMQNSLKHAGCKTISVAIEKNNKVLKLCAEDDGKGFDINHMYNTSKGICLKNIMKRGNLLALQWICIA